MIPKKAFLAMRSFQNKRTRDVFRQAAYGHTARRRDKSPGNFGSFPGEAVWERIAQGLWKAVTAIPPRSSRSTAIKLVFAGKGFAGV
jgi:hypothetical protein